MQKRRSGRVRETGLFHRIRTLLFTAASAFRNSKGLEDRSHGAEFGESELQKVSSDKGGKPEPVFAHENRACFHSKGQAEQDEKTGNGMNPVCYSHRLYSFILFFSQRPRGRRVVCTFKNYIVHQHMRWCCLRTAQRRCNRLNR